MLWLPTQKWRKAIARLKHRRRRRRIARLLLFLFVCFGLTTAAVPSRHALSARLTDLTRSDQFDFVDWETQAVSNEIGRRVASCFIPPYSVDVVQTFLNQEEQIEQLQQQLRQLYAKSELNPKIKPLRQELIDLKAKQNQIIPQVEIVLARQVESVLHDEGFTMMGRVFPPIAFRLIDPPTLLIISPRDKIERQETIGLQPGLSDSHRNEIETALDQGNNISSYITDIGGLSSYPTMVINDANLIYLINVIIHEWTHTYLITFPTNVSWGYFIYPQLRTINETTASLMGQELSRQVILRYYPKWIERLPPLDNNGQAKPAPPSEYDLSMRYTRQEVDRLLAEGKIESAETLMETERQKLVDKGYTLRKINQAYFAFNGSYALGEASVDPTGTQLRQLWTASPSVKGFLDRVGWLNSYDDYLAWLKEIGLDSHVIEQK